jgi:hypothetical protein
MPVIVKGMCQGNDRGKTTSKIFTTSEIILIIRVREKGRNFIKKSRNFMKNEKLTIEEIKKAEIVIQHIFASLNKKITIFPSFVDRKCGRSKSDNFYFCVAIGEEKTISVFSNMDTLVLDISNIASQICKELDIKENDPIYDFIRDGDKARHDKIEEFLKTIK